MIEFFYVFHYSSVFVYLVISKKCNITRMSDSQDLPVPQQSGPGLEQSSEHVELKVWDVIIAGQVYGGLERHGLQTWK